MGKVLYKAGGGRVAGEWRNTKGADGHVGRGFSIERGIQTFCTLC